MEVGTFVDSAVAEQLENNFVEARLHTDLHPEFRDLQKAIAQSIAQPIYIVVPANSSLDFQTDSFDPTQVRIIGRQDGATINNPEKFAAFLESAASAN